MTKKVTVIGLWVKPDHVFGTTDGGTRYGNHLLWPEIRAKELLEPLGFEFHSERELPPEQADVVLCIDVNRAIWDRVRKLPDHIIKLFQVWESPVYAPLDHDVCGGVLSWRGWQSILTWDRGFETDNTVYYDLPVTGTQVGDPLTKRADKVQNGVAVVSRKMDFCGNSWSRENLLMRLSELGEIDLFGQRWKVNPGKNMLGPADDKIGVMQGHSFGLAMENCRASGYVTEKLPDCILAGLPVIYWGDEETAERRFPGTFVSMHDLTVPSFLEAKKRLFANYDALLKNVQKARELSPAWCDSYLEGMCRIFRKIDTPRDIRGIQS